MKDKRSQRILTEVVSTIVKEDDAQDNENIDFNADKGTQLDVKSASSKRGLLSPIKNKRSWIQIENDYGTP